MTEYFIRNFVIRFHSLNEEYKSYYRSIKRWSKNRNEDVSQIDAVVISRLLENFRNLSLDLIQYWDHPSKKKKSASKICRKSTESNASARKKKITELYKSEKNATVGCKTSDSAIRQQIEQNLNESQGSCGQSSAKTSRFNKFCKYKNESSFHANSLRNNSVNLETQISASANNEDSSNKKIYTKPTLLTKSLKTSQIETVNTKSLNQFTDISELRCNKDIITQSQMTLQSTKEYLLLSEVNSRNNKVFGGLYRSCSTRNAADLRSSPLHSETSSFSRKKQSVEFKRREEQPAQIRALSSEKMPQNISKLMTSLNKRLETFKAREFSPEGIL